MAYRRVPGRDLPAVDHELVTDAQVDGFLTALPTILDEGLAQSEAAGS